MSSTSPREQVGSLNLAHEVPSLEHRPGFLFHCGISPITRRAASALSLYAEEMLLDPWSTFFPRLKRIAETRQLAASLIGARANEIAFTKSTTHGLLLVAQSIDWEDGDVILVDEQTFPANWYVWTALEEKYGVRVVPWPERDFGYDLDELEKLLARHTVRMVAISAADYATGFRHDLNALGFMVKNAGALFCLDAIQAVGVVPVDVKQAQVDFLSADGHKWMMGPEGAGIFYVNPAVHHELNDSMTGWLGRQNFQEYGNRHLAPAPDATRFEEGALNMPGILALGGSLSLLADIGMEKIWSRVQANQQVIQSWGTAQNFRQISPSSAEHSSGISAFQMPDSVNVDQLVKRAAEAGVIVSSRRTFLRIAPHFYQEPEHVEAALECLTEC